MVITDKYVFFLKDWLSNFARCQICWPDERICYKTFSSTEQGFMYEKAMTFKDFETANKILQTDSPLLCKELGRKVKNYDDKVWAEKRYDIFYNLNYLKYSQNKDLHEKLLDPKFDDKTFVECNPNDRIWGIGYTVHDAQTTPEKQWGQNLLGKIITEVRKQLIDEELLNVTEKWK